jgi:hypothetical protein
MPVRCGDASVRLPLLWTSSKCSMVTFELNNAGRDGRRGAGRPHTVDNTMTHQPQLGVGLLTHSGEILTKGLKIRRYWYCTIPYIYTVYCTIELETFFFFLFFLSDFQAVTTNRQLDTIWQSHRRGQLSFGWLDSSRDVCGHVAWSYSMAAGYIALHYIGSRSRKRGDGID